MDDDRGFTNSRFLLEAIVVIALVGTFVVYGYPGDALYRNPGQISSGYRIDARAPGPDPAEIAKLGSLH